MKTSVLNMGTLFQKEITMLIEIRQTVKSYSSISLSVMCEGASRPLFFVSVAIFANSVPLLLIHKSNAYHPPYSTSEHL